MYDWKENKKKRSEYVTAPTAEDKWSGKSSSSKASKAIDNSKSEENNDDEYETVIKPDGSMVRRKKQKKSAAQRIAGAIAGGLKGYADAKTPR